MILTAVGGREGGNVTPSMYSYMQAAFYLFIRAQPRAGAWFDNNKCYFGGQRASGGCKALSCVFIYSLDLFSLGSSVSLLVKRDAHYE